MNLKAKLKPFFDSDKEPNEYIEKYEYHITFFEDLIKTNRKEHLEFAIKIKLHNYIYSLVSTGDYKKALDELNKIEHLIKPVHFSKIWYPTHYKMFIYLKAICLGHLKKYKKSNSYFLRVLEIYPNSERCLKWYRENKISILNKYYIPTIYAGIIIYCILIFNDFFDLFHVPSIVNTLLTTSVTIILITYFIIKRIITNPKSSNNFSEN